MEELSVSLMHILVVAELSCAQSGPYFHQTPLVIIKTHPPRNVTAAFFLAFFFSDCRTAGCFWKLHTSNYLSKISFKFCLWLRFLIMTPRWPLLNAVWIQELFCHLATVLCKLHFQVGASWHPWALLWCRADWRLYFRIHFKQTALVLWFNLGEPKSAHDLFIRFQIKQEGACYFLALFIKC